MDVIDLLKKKIAIIINDNKFDRNELIGMIPGLDSEYEGIWRK